MPKRFQGKYFWHKLNQKKIIGFFLFFQVIHCAVSLGGVHSLAMYPPRTSHKFLSKEEQVIEKLTAYDLARFKIK